MTQRTTARLIADGMAFTEGPTWVEEHGLLLFTDIPASRIMRFSAETGLGVWRESSHFAIGLQAVTGAVLCCEHAGRALTRLEIRPDGTAGSRRVLAAEKRGQLLNAPNDVCVSRAGEILFTDPPFGVRTEDGRPDYPGLVGYQVGQERPGCFVYRVTEDASDPDEILTDIHRPNGIAWNCVESRLYVSDSSEEFHCVYLYECGPDGFGTRQDFAVMPVGVPDGICVDSADNLYVAGGDGVHVYGANGEQAAHIAVPEMVTNVCLGGSERDTLYITATTGLYEAEPLAPGPREENR
jgi:gluconolactonase